MLYIFLLAFSIFAHAEGEPILIGQTIPMSGPSSVGGLQRVKGQTLYFNRINASGGVNGSKIEIRSYDDAYDPVKSVENVKTLVEKDKVLALFQIYGSASAKATLPLVEKYDIPMIAVAASDHSIIVPPKKNIFGGRLTSKTELDESIKFAIETLKAKDFGIVFQEDATGQAGRLAAIGALYKFGLKLKAEGSYKHGSLEVTDAVDKMIKAKVDLVILAGQIKPGAKVVNESIEKNFHPYFLGNSIIATKEFSSNIKSKDPKVYVALSLPPFGGKNAPEVFKRYLEDAKAANVTPDQTQLEGYLNAIVLVEALKRAGPQPTRNSIRSAMETMTEFDMGGVVVNYSPTNHQGYMNVYMARLKDGEFQGL